MSAFGRPMPRIPATVARGLPTSMQEMPEFAYAHPAKRGYFFDSI